MWFACAKCVPLMWVITKILKNGSLRLYKKCKLSTSFQEKSERKMEAKRNDIMMFPWLAFGHMIPFFELSKRLAAKGIMVSYISTPRNLQRLPPIPSSLAPNMKLLQLQMQSVDGLPDNCEATIDIQKAQTPFLKQAHDTLAEPFEHLLQKVKPDLILVDFAAYRISQVAAKYGVRTAYFSVYTAATLAYLGPPSQLRASKQHPTPPESIPSPSQSADKEDHGTKMMGKTHVPDASGVSSGQRLAMIVEECSFVLVRSCEEFEGKYLHLIQELYQKKVLPIGLLPPIPFLWILRKPQGVDSSELLPQGFAKRTLSQGLVVLDWAPQQAILAHPAIGGCLYHSGWGTTVESLGHGHPLVLLPMISDQGLTAKLLVENQVGYEVPRNKDGSFSRDVVAESIRRVLVEEEGAQLRLKE